MFFKMSLSSRARERLRSPFLTQIGEKKFSLEGIHEIWFIKCSFLMFQGAVFRSFKERSLTFFHMISLSFIDLIQILRKLKESSYFYI